LTFILEAADDIAYVTADLEDAYKKGLFSIDTVTKCFDEYLKEYEEQNMRSQDGNIQNNLRYSRKIVDELKQYKDEDETTAFHRWVFFARQWLMYCAAYKFADNYGKIMKGSYSEELLQGTFQELTVDIIKKKIMTEYVFNDTGILHLELAAQKIINTLLERFVPAVLSFDAEKGKCASASMNKLYHLLPLELRKSYKHWYSQADKDSERFESEDIYHKLLLVTDYISGMTDSYAKNIYQSLEGIY